MNLNETLESVHLHHPEAEVVVEDDEFAPPQRPKRVDDTELDITPMIDITFLLLIFFLVASRPDQASSIQLARAQHAATVNNMKASIISVAAPTGELAPVYLCDGTFDDKLVPDDPEALKTQIEDYIKAGLREGKDEVVIKGDRNTPCRDIERVLKAVSRVEGTQISLGVLQQR